MIARLLMPKMYFLDNVVDKVCRNDGGRRREVTFK